MSISELALEIMRQPLTEELARLGIRHRRCRRSVSLGPRECHILAAVISPKKNLPLMRFWTHEGAYCRALPPPFIHGPGLLGEMLFAVQTGQRSSPLDMWHIPINDSIPWMPTSNWWAKFTATPEYYI